MKRENIGPLTDKRLRQFTHDEPNRPSIKVGEAAAMAFELQRRRHAHSGSLNAMELVKNYVSAVLPNEELPALVEWLDERDDEKANERLRHRTGTAVELSEKPPMQPAEATVVWANGKQTTEMYIGNKLPSATPFQVREGLEEGCVYDVEPDPEDDGMAGLRAGIKREFGVDVPLVDWRNKGVRCANCGKPAKGQYDCDDCGTPDEPKHSLEERVAKLEAAAEYSGLCDNCASAKAVGGFWPGVHVEDFAGKHGDNSNPQIGRGRTIVGKVGSDGFPAFSFSPPTPAQARQKGAMVELERLIKAFQDCDDEEDFNALINDEDLTAVGLLSMFSDFVGGTK